MWQRKQSLFLLLAAICGALTFVFPVDTFTQGDHTFLFRTTGFFMGNGIEVVDVASKVPFGVLLGFLSVLFTVIIFLYRNRTRQLRLTRAGSLVTLAILVFLFITDNSMRAYLEQGGEVSNSYGASAFLPIAMIVFTYLAERSIRKDEALVKSMDRLR